MRTFAHMRGFLRQCCFMMPIMMVAKQADNGVADDPWYSNLVPYPGTIPWSTPMGQYPGYNPLVQTHVTTPWHNTPVQYPGTIPWHNTLEQSPGTTPWRSPEQYPGTVPWHNTPAQSPSPLVRSPGTIPDAMSLCGPATQPLAQYPDTIPWYKYPGTPWYSTVVQYL